MKNKVTIFLVLLILLSRAYEVKAITNDQMMNIVNKLNKRDEVLQGKLNEEKIKAQLEMKRLWEEREKERRRQEQLVLSAAKYNKNDYMRGARDLKRIKNIIENSNPPPQVKKLINSTIKYIGKPYVWGGDDLRTASHSYDCSGFTKSIYSKVGFKLPRTARGQIKVVKPVHPSEVKMGDLIFFENTYPVEGASHVGIYLKDGYMIHASSGKGYITIDTIMNEYWMKHFLGFGRLIESKGEGNVHK